MRSFPSFTGSLPLSEPLVSPDATEDQWLAARRERVSASEIAAVMGVSPHASPFSLYWSKVNEWDVVQTFAMSVGTKLEPVVADLFADAYPDLVVHRPQHRLYGRVGNLDVCASPDFLVTGPPHYREVRPLETKSDEGGPWGKTGTADVPYHHKLQVWAQCYTLGASIGYIARLAGKRFTVHPIPYDADAFRPALQAAARFRTDLAVGNAPDIDGHAATAATLEMIEPAVIEDESVDLPEALVREFADAYEAASVAAERLDAVKNRVRWAMGRAEYAKRADGRKVVKRQVFKRSGFTVPPTAIDKLYIYQGWQE